MSSSLLPSSNSNNNSPQQQQLPLHGTICRRGGHHGENVVSSGPLIRRSVSSTSSSSSIIPKLVGSIVKRFSLNYSGEGLVTEPNSLGGVTRTVRVGIRLQVQVDSILNNRDLSLKSPPASPPQSLRIARATSVPSSIDSAYASSSDCSSYSPSSGVSSESGSNPHSPLNPRRILPGGGESTAFHNRINQALLSTGSSTNTSCRSSPISSPALSRSSSILSSPSSSPSSSSWPLVSPGPKRTAGGMEDSSSYQMLRYFPGSNVNSVREFSWEQAAFEKDVSDKVEWLGAKFSSLRLPVPSFVVKSVGGVKAYAAENPINTVLILAVILASALPVSIFLGFAIATILISLFGFLIVEGTLLTVGTVTLGGAILIVGLITLVLLTIGSVGYVTLSKTYSWFTGGKELKLLLAKIPVLGSILNLVSSSSSPQTKPDSDCDMNDL